MRARVRGPRLRDLPSKRIYVFEPVACPRELRGLIGGKLRQSLIASNWPDILLTGEYRWQKR